MLLTYLQEHLFPHLEPRYQELILLGYERYLKNNGHLKQWESTLTPPLASRPKSLLAIQEGAPLLGPFSSQKLELLKPWRKGPWRFGDTLLDAEWRCDQKWERLLPHLPRLEKKTLLDIGCGNGYYLFRMLEQEPHKILGIDPTALYFFQFLAAYCTHPDPRLTLLPIAWEDFEHPPQTIDIAFSMGVLYHSRSPLEHLFQIRQLLKPKGTLVLETLVVPPEFGPVLVPQERYQGMKNVWFLPTTQELLKWLKKLKFKEAELCDLTPTTQEEQRVTPWSSQRSLSSHLNPEDPSQTIEGHPAPLRAIFLAKK